MERKARTFEYQIYELKEKLENKTRLFNQLKWKFEKASSIITDNDLKKVIGLENFKQKVDKFNMDLNQIITTKDNIVA